MASILEQVWEYKKFSELTPTAAEKASKQTTLFSLDDSLTRLYLNAIPVIPSSRYNLKQGDISCHPSFLQTC